MEKYLCKLEDFNYFITERLDNNWKKNCGVTKANQLVNYSKYSGLVVLLFSINLLLVALLVFLVMVQWNTKRGYVQSSADGLKTSLIDEYKN